METKKITVASCKLIKDFDTYKTYQIIDSEGNRYGSTQEFTEGEHDVEVSQKGAYTNIKKVQQKKQFPVKDVTFDRRRVALECSIQLNSESVDVVLKNAEAFEKWLGR